MSELLRHQSGFKISRDDSGSDARLRQEIQGISPSISIEMDMRHAAMLMYQAGLTVEQLRKSMSTPSPEVIQQLTATLQALLDLHKKDNDRFENKPLLKDLEELAFSVEKIMQQHPNLQKDVALIDFVLTCSDIFSYRSDGSYRRTKFLNTLAETRFNEQHKARALAVKGTTNDTYVYRCVRGEIPDGVVDAYGKTADAILQEIAQRKKIVGTKDQVDRALQELGFTIPGFAEVRPRQGWIGAVGYDWNPDRYRYRQAKLIFIDDDNNVAIVQVADETIDIYDRLKEECGLRLITDYQQIGVAIRAIESVSRMLNIKI